MMRHRASAFALAARVIPLLVTVAGCGGTESTASRSAAAYDDAQRKGVPVGQSAHGAPEAHREGGRAAEPGSPKAAVSPAMPGMQQSRTRGTASQAAPRTDSHAAMDHSKMPGMTPPGGAMDHSSMPGVAAQATPGTDQHAGMDHANMPGMSHDDRHLPTPSPEPPSATARSGQPAATLQPDALDQAPSTSIADAARSAAMAAEMSGGSHAMSHDTYRQVDAGRNAEAPSPKPSPHQEHKH